MTRFTLFFVAFAALLTSACGPNGETTSADTIPRVSSDSLKAHVEFLADDSLEGRATGSPGYDEAAIYVAKRFEEIGLKPVGVNGTYFQPIRFHEVRLVEDTPQLIVRGPKAAKLRAFPASYYFYLTPREALDLSAEIVFVGYGVNSPDAGLDSYADVDVKDKIVVALNGAPEGLAPELSAILSSTQRKAKDAANAGAIGLILVYTDSWEENVDYGSRRDRAMDSKLFLPDADGRPLNPYAGLEAIVQMAPDAAAGLFEDAEMSNAAVRTLAAENSPIKSFPLARSITLSKRQETRLLTSANVIGKLAGSVEGAGAGAILLLAHLDHLGKASEGEGDLIYNGAIDNALGVASLIEIAKSLAATQPERSIFFAAVTGEEQGLLGAQYLSKNLPLWEGALLAALNIDMPVALYPFTSVLASGASHSTLGKFAQETANAFDLTLEADPMPQEAIFVRSDHYPFAQEGIPALYLNIGVKTPKGEQIDGLSQLKAFLKDHYHKPSDSMDLPIDWTAAALFADVHADLIRRIAAQDANIEWAQDSFLKP